jgi:hypothetical protein
MAKDEGDLLDSLLKAEEPVVDDDDALKDVPTNEDVNALKEQIEALNKEKHGLLQDVKGERRKRQEISGRLNQLTDTVNGILDQRDTAQEILNSQRAADPTPSRGIPVQYGEDGEAFVDPSTIEKMLTPYQKKIQQLEEDLQLTESQQAANIEADKIKEAIIGEDERFYLANSKYQAARKWVVDQVIDFSRQNGINHTITSGQALDFVFDKNLQTEFENLHPNMNLVDVVTAEDSQHHFRQMLSNVVGTTSMIDDSSPDSTIDSRFQKVLKKPSALGDQANAKAGALTISEKMAQLTPEELIGLTDAQAAALEKALLEEEKTDGIQF